jgi:predicted nucleic acid-binding protein
MVAKVADRAFVDTNVLLAATDEAREEHRGAIAVFDEWPAESTALYASGQVIREYLSVATRPVETNGLGLSQSDALANAYAFCDRMQLLDESARVTDRLLTLLEEVACSGKQVHDANLVATMLTHGIDTIVTMNADDFVRFKQYITILPLT